jgi:hypothetical protein
MAQVFIVVVIIVILIALGFGLMGVLRGGKQGSDKMFKSLVTRVALSVALFAFVMFAGYMGWIEPNGIMIDAPVSIQK